MSLYNYRKKSLQFANIDLANVAKQVGTPCYVYSKQVIDFAIESFKKALTPLSCRICYAVKANSNIAILQCMVKQGIGFDIVSIGELIRVIAAGGQPENIIFSGVGKRSDEIESAIQTGIYCFDVESTAEINRIREIAIAQKKRVNIILRVNPNVDPQSHAYISTGLYENKFGIDIEEIPAIAAQFSNDSALSLIGIACHIGSQITELNPFKLAIENMLALYEQLKQSGIVLKHINIGGGLGIIYQTETPPSIDEYAALITKKFKGVPVEIILEPGRALVGEAGVLITKIEFIKKTAHKHFAIVDAGMNDLIRPALYEAWHPILPLHETSHPQQTYDIVGPVCESGDFLGKDRSLRISEGDYLVVGATGAYGFCMSSNYNSRPRACEVLMDNGKLHVIRERETEESLFANERLLIGNT